MAKRLRSRDPLVYELVELRRQQWDLLIWQIPAFAFAAQAFIFTILLSPETAAWARVLACALSVGVSVLALLLLARHRQAEETDASWLSQYEIDAGWPETDRQHGPDWQKRRDLCLPGLSSEEMADVRRRRAANERLPDMYAVRATGYGKVPLRPGYRTWVLGFYATIVLALAAAVLGLIL